MVNGMNSPRLLARAVRTPNAAQEGTADLATTGVAKHKQCCYAQLQQKCQRTLAAVCVLSRGGMLLDEPFRPPLWEGTAITATPL